MNIALINPPVLNNKIFMKEIGRCGSTASSNQLWPQTGLAYLASIVSITHRTIIIDGIAEQLTHKKVLDKIHNHKSEIIIVHTTTPTFENDMSFILKLKSRFPRIKVGVVGNHVSNSIKDSLKYGDFALINEPELTFEEIINGKKWSKIKGLAYNKEGKVVINNYRPMDYNLDKLPFPSRHLLPNQKYKMILTNNEPFTTVVASRGCPYECIYCRVGYPWGKKFRQRSVENVISELKEIKNRLKIKNIVFMSDTFTLDRQWIIRFSKKLIGENLNMRWLCNSRVDSIDKEMLHYMKKSGCDLISFGVESGSQRVLDNVKKKITLNQSRTAIRLTKKVGIRAFAYFIIGLPGETKETINETIKFAKDIDPDYVNFHIVTPYYGTELYRMAEKNKWIVDYDSNHYDQSGDYAVMKNDNLSSSDILKAQRRAMRQFYLQPRKVIQNLANIKNLKDFNSSISVALRYFK